jgi:hypothetical protein
LYTNITKTITSRSATAIQNFFLELHEHLKDNHKDFVFGNAGIPIMLYLLEPIIAHIGKIPTANDFTLYCKSVSQFFIEYYDLEEEVKKLRAITNSEGARKSIARQIGLYLRKGVKDKNFWPQMEQDEFISEIADLERGIAKLIAGELSSVTTSWEKQRVPQTIFQIAKKQMEQDGSSFDENLSLGDESQIILQRNNWDEIFEKIFISKKHFKDQSEVVLAFKYLSEVRNPTVHGKSVITSKDTLTQCRIYMDKFDKILPKISLES